MYTNKVVPLRDGRLLIMANIGLYCSMRWLEQSVRIDWIRWDASDNSCTACSDNKHATWITISHMQQEKNLSCLCLPELLPSIPLEIFCTLMLTSRYLVFRIQVSSLKPESLISSTYPYLHVKFALNHAVYLIWFMINTLQFTLRCMINEALKA